MEALTMMNELLTFMEQNRRGGTTKFLEGISKETGTPIYVVSANKDEAEQFGDSGVSIYNLHLEKGNAPGVVLIDNHVLLKLLQQGVQELRDNQEQLSKMITAYNKLRITISEMHQAFYPTQPRPDPVFGMGRLPKLNL